MDKGLKKIIGFLIIVSMIGNFISCKDDEDYKDIKLTTGIYMGNFDYQGTKYFCQINFDSTKYVEVPSGGVAYQKSENCLTVGSYAIHGNKIVFTLDSFKYPGNSANCESDMLLPGEYTIYNTNVTDSIYFEKGKDSNKIKYYLKKLIID